MKVCSMRQTRHHLSLGSLVLCISHDLSCTLTPLPWYDVIPKCEAIISTSLRSSSLLSSNTHKSRRLLFILPPRRGCWAPYLKPCVLYRLVFLGCWFLLRDGKRKGMFPNEYLYTIIIHQNECNWFLPLSLSYFCMYFEISCLFHNNCWCCFCSGSLSSIGLWQSRSSSSFVRTRDILPIGCASHFVTSSDILYFLEKKRGNEFLSKWGWKWVSLARTLLVSRMKGQKRKENALQFIMRTKKPCIIKEHEGVTAATSFYSSKHYWTFPKDSLRVSQSFRKCNRLLLIFSHLLHFLLISHHLFFSCSHAWDSCFCWCCITVVFSFSEV